MCARILVIDDDAGIRELLRMMLERQGYRVEEAQDGSKALNKYSAEPHDLVITDLIMPEKEGIETIRELRRYDPNVKIIAISGGGTVDSERYLYLAQRLGVQRTFSKPFQVSDILAAVEELLETPNTPA